MRFYKTNCNRRINYTYPSVTGECITIHPGDGYGGETVADVHIKTLHSFDDGEVYNNCKNCRPPRTTKEKQEILEWEKEHPGEKFPKNWNLSLDTFSDDLDSDMDRSDLMREVYGRTHEDNPVVERFWEVMEDMPPKQKRALALVELEDYSMTEVAVMFGCSVANVSKLVAKAKEFIKKNY